MNWRPFRFNAETLYEPITLPCPVCGLFYQQVDGELRTEADPHRSDRKKVVIPFRCEYGHQWEMEIAENESGRATLTAKEKCK